MCSNCKKMVKLLPQISLWSNSLHTHHTFVTQAMKKLKNYLLAVLAMTSLAFTGCLHIIEEATFRNNGSGTYQMTLDMSEMKGMMDMFKSMGDEAPKKEGAEGEASDEAPDMGAAPDNGITQMGSELSSVAQSLKNVVGLSNINEISDTSAFRFGYSFDFADVAALNRAMKIINKEKYDSKVEEVFRFKNGNFERLTSADLGEQMKKQLAESEESDESGTVDADMLKTFFADMTYKQIYHFPDSKIKKSTNTLSEISQDGHSLTITLKPFDEEQMKGKPSVGTAVKLK